MFYFRTWYSYICVFYLFLLLILFLLFMVYITPRTFWWCHGRIYVFCLAGVANALDILCLAGPITYTTRGPDSSTVVCVQHLAAWNRRLLHAFTTSYRAHPSP